MMTTWKYAVLRKGILSAVAAGILFSGTAVSSASYINPYSQVQTKVMNQAEEAAYIDQKTTQIFTPSASSSRPASTTYVAPQGWQQEKLQFGQVPVEKYTYAEAQTDRILLFLHGGGYVGALHNRYRDWGIHLAELAGNASLLAVDYRIAPAHVYPAALEDAVTAYKGLLDAGYDPEKIILAGDSAGGNLAIALSLYARDHQLPQPKALVLISPWTSMENNLPSRMMNYEADQILGIKNRRLSPEIETPSYAQGQDLKNPYLSPVYADAENLPSMLITSGGSELFLDDTALFAAHAKSAGVPVQYTVYPGMSHDWTILLPELPESRAMNEEITAFVNQQFS